MTSKAPGNPTINEQAPLLEDARAAEEETPIGLTFRSQHRRNRSADFQRVRRARPVDEDDARLLEPLSSFSLTRKFSDSHLDQLDDAQVPKSQAAARRMVYRGSASTGTPGQSTLTPQPSSMKRKLSETRGVKLSDIRIDPPTPRPTDLSEEPAERRVINRVEGTPPLTSSPITHVIARQSHAAGQPDSRNSPSSFEATIDVRIFFSNDNGIQFTVQGGRHATADYLLSLVAQHFQLDVAVVRQAFAIWMISPLLEVQLKPHHVPYEVCKGWTALLKRFTDGSDMEDVPVVVFKRSVQLTTTLEEELATDCRIAAFLFEDARADFLADRSVVDTEMAVEAAAYQFSVEFGAYKKEEHDVDFVREHVDDFLPASKCRAVRSKTLFGLPIAGCGGLEHEILSKWKDASVFNDAEINKRQAMDYFLQKLRLSPTYGCAFFEGEIERPSTGWRKIVSHFSDLKVLVGINHENVCVVDQAKGDLLLVQPLVDCSWRRIDCEENDEENRPSLFLHFPGAKLQLTGISGSGKLKPGEHPLPGTKLLRIFSHQAVMIDALMTSLRNMVLEEREAKAAEEEAATLQSEDEASVDTASEGRGSEVGKVEVDGGHVNVSFEPQLKPIRRFMAAPPPGPPPRVELKEKKCAQQYIMKMSKLCLSSFDSSGQCIDAQGSLKRIFQPQLVK